MIKNLYPYAKLIQEKCLSLHRKDENGFMLIDCEKCEFQFGIVEDTPMLAEGRLFHLIGNDARKLKFSPRKISEGEIAKMQSKKNKKEMQ